MPGAMRRTPSNVVQVFNGKEWIDVDLFARDESASAHWPKRGSDVEVWLMAQRDLYELGSREWVSLDQSLDEYRLRADHGRKLSDSIEDIH